MSIKNKIDEFLALRALPVAVSIVLLPGLHSPPERVGKCGMFHNEYYELRQLACMQTERGRRFQLIDA